jgi:hypothetical protein
LDEPPIIVFKVLVRLITVEQLYLPRLQGQRYVVSELDEYRGLRKVLHLGGLDVQEACTRHHLFALVQIGSS